MKIGWPPEASVVKHLFEDSEFFLQEARRNSQIKDQKATRRYIRASIITALAAVEAVVNTMLSLLDEDADLELIERAFIQEKGTVLTKDGCFDIDTSRNLYRSFEEKARFLYWKTKGVRLPKGNVAWESFIEAKKLRGEIIHPKPGRVSYSKLTIPAAESCLTATLKIAQTLGWPAHDRAPA